MDIELTAATRRAVQAAGRWTLDGPGCVLRAPAMLLGLLLEPECRAAILLRSLNIQASAVQSQWPALRQEQTLDPDRDSVDQETPWEELVPRFSPEMQTAIGIACDWLADLPRPLMLATEHLLLGLAASDDEVGCWLRQHGLNARALRDEILRQYGLTIEPLEMEQWSPERRTRSEESHLSETHSSEEVVSIVESCRLPGEPPAGQADLLRLLDASANRAREALRVVEDYVRFVLDDQHLTERLKVLRHGLTSALAGISTTERLATRDTQADVGTSLSTTAEQLRRDSDDVLTANFTRLQESLRSLEEFSKIGNIFPASAIEQLRYESYTLHKAVQGTVDGLARMAGARLYVLVDGRSSVDAFERLVVSLVKTGVGVIQLRDKTLRDRELLDRARRLRDFTCDQPSAVADMTRCGDTLFIMNDRPDLAVLAGADGVHVGQEELSVRQVRQIVGPRMLVGVSTHRIDEARQAVLDGASYLGVGPIFPSGTKTFSEFPGLEFARNVASEIRLPAFAIGGIDSRNVAQVLATGVSRVAVSGAVVAAADPADAARGLLERLKAVR